MTKPAVQGRATLPGGLNRKDRPISQHDRKAWRKGSVYAADFRPLDPNQRAKIRFLAEAMDPRTHQPGQPGGFLGRSGLAVLRTLITRFHNVKTGRLDPSCTAIAKAANVARSTAQDAIARLEPARGPDLTGGRLAGWCPRVHASTLWSVRENRVKDARWRMAGWSSGQAQGGWAGQDGGGGGAAREVAALVVETHAPVRDGVGLGVGWRGVAYRFRATIPYTPRTILQPVSAGAPGGHGERT
jgi:hypothetical protein